MNFFITIIILYVLISHIFFAFHFSKVKNYTVKEGSDKVFYKNKSTAAVPLALFDEKKENVTHIDLTHLESDETGTEHVYLF